MPVAAFAPQRDQEVTLLLRWDPGEHPILFDPLPQVVCPVRIRRSFVVDDFEHDRGRGRLGWSINRTGQELMPPVSMYPCQLRCSIASVCSRRRCHLLRAQAPQPERPVTAATRAAPSVM